MFVPIPWHHRILCPLFFFAWLFEVATSALLCRGTSHAAQALEGEDVLLHHPVLLHHGGILPDGAEHAEQILSVQSYYPEVRNVGLLDGSFGPLQIPEAAFATQRRGNRIWFSCSP